MCYPAGEFMIGDSDVLLGHIGGAPFLHVGGAIRRLAVTGFAGGRHSPAWGHVSLDNGRERRFLLISEACVIAGK